MTELPSGTVTFLFSDIEGSTRLLHELGERYADVLAEHHRVLREAFSRHGGVEVGTQGDGFFVVFARPGDAVAAALDVQDALTDGAVRVRIGIHTGDAGLTDEGYVGIDVHRAARIMDAGHGGQVLLSETTRQLLDSIVEFRELGEHRLKDLSAPQRLYQLGDREFPPLRTLYQSNLPIQPTPLVGRERELEDVGELLRSHRLLTLVGPGGIGKTRLALQSAAEQIDRFEGGVYFVDLSPARDPDTAFEAVVRAIGLTTTSDATPLHVLKEGMTRKTLLLLDNFEQVMEAADGVGELLRHCAELKILVTSREALRVRGEHLFAVPPLAEEQAVRLFVERAVEARPGFALTDDDAAAVADISARLDGLPLAIELAAARLNLFSPHDLRDRLRRRLELLDRGPRDLPARHQTLRGTIEWSYELLDAEEQAIFRLLSVFSPTRVEAIEEVVARLGSLQGIDVVDRLTSLVDKSLVRAVQGPGRQRLAMLETIREYAAERLEEEPELASQARQAHAAYFAEFARERRGALDELESEHGNLMTAWQHWVAARELEQLDKLLDALWALHDARGWYHAAVELTNDLLGVLAAVPSTPDRAREEITLRASLARGLMALRGYTEEVEQNYARALALTEEAGGLPQRASVLRSLASFYLYRGEFDKASALGRELLDVAEQQDDEGLQVEGQLVLGSSLAFLGDVRVGLNHLDRAIALFHPDRHGTGRFRLGPNPGVVAHTTSALVLWLVGHPERAVERATAAVELARRLNHPFTLAYTLFHVGFLDLWRRELELVEERASGALAVAEQHDYQIWRALGLVLRGVATAGLGRPGDGLALVERGSALYEGLKTPPVFWPLLLSMRASAVALAGRPAQALELIDEAIAIAPEGAFLYPEFALLKGDLLLTLADADGAERAFQSAFDGAGSLGIRTLQLRAATRLGRRDPLRAVYETFTEGFDTADLVEARAVLDDMDARVV